MLTIFQPTRLILRQLATASSSSHVSRLDKGIPGAIPKANTVPIENNVTPSHKLEALQDKETRIIGVYHDTIYTTTFDNISAAPIAKPVYLTMSELLYPAPDAPPASDQVIKLDPTVFSHPIRKDIIHLCVVHYRDSLRQGSGSTKTRSEVRGSGRKIRPQKGSGKARLGDGQSPMLRGGGIAFGPKPRDFSTKLPRKVIEMGMRVALSAKLKEQRLGVVETLDWPGVKTRPLVRRISSLGWIKTLFVTGEKEVPVGLLRSGSNIPDVDFATVDQLKVYDLVYWQRVVLDTAAVEILEARLSKTSPLFGSRILPRPVLAPMSL